MVLSLESHLAVHESPASARCRKLEEGKRDRFHVQHMQVAAYFDYGLFTLSCHGKLDSIPKEPHFQRYVMQVRKLLKRQDLRNKSIRCFYEHLRALQRRGGAAAKNKVHIATGHVERLSMCTATGHSTTFECSARDSETKPNS